jgi:hypothetical protein
VLLRADANPIASSSSLRLFEPQVAEGSGLPNVGFGGQKPKWTKPANESALTSTTDMMLKYAHRMLWNIIAPY